MLIKFCLSHQRVPGMKRSRILAGRRGWTDQLLSSTATRLCIAGDGS